MFIKIFYVWNDKTKLSLLAVQRTSYFRRVDQTVVPDCFIKETLQMSRVDEFTCHIVVVHPCEAPVKEQ